MKEVEIVIRDMYSRVNQNGEYICNVSIDGELKKVLKGELKGCSRVVLLVTAIKKCIGIIPNNCKLHIITLTSWGGSIIRRDDGTWREYTDKRVQASPNKDILMDLQSLLKSKGHILTSFTTSRNTVLDKVSVNNGVSQTTYMSFKVDREIKRKFEELCYSKGVDEEKVINKILKSFIDRNMK